MSALTQTIHVVLRKRQVCQRIGLSSAQIYAMLDPKSSSHDPSFPRQFRLGAGAVGWLEHEIQEWLETRIKISRSERNPRSTHEVQAIIINERNNAPACPDRHSRSSDVVLVEAALAMHGGAA